MKFIILSLGFCLSLQAFADNKKSRPTVERLVKCLGKEEARIHKEKLGGAVYELNQRLISELLMISKIEVSPAALADICKENSKTLGSVKVLEYLVTNEENFFSFPRTISKVDRAINRSTMNELLDMLPEIFYQYVSRVQSEAARPGCIEDHIPALKELNRDVKALEQDIPARKLMRRNQMAIKILKGLRDTHSILSKCDDEYKRKLEEEKKKREQTKT